MDADLASIQHARTLVAAARTAQRAFKDASQETADRIVAAMAAAGANAAEPLARAAFEETGWGRVESKVLKNLFATRTLAARMEGMKTAGIIRRDAAVWEIASPMGVVAALVPSTNPTSTALYKAIIAAKARCALVVSPHPRARACTAEAVRVVAAAAYAAGAPEGLFGCLEAPTAEATNALLEHPGVDVILATGGGAMVRAAYSKGKPAYGVGSGNVPVYVDRSADVDRAAARILAGTAFDWGTLCSTERSVVADAPIRSRLVAAMRARGAHFCSEAEKAALRGVVFKDGHFNADQVGQAPHRIAAMAGFRVPETTRALVAEVTEVGRAEPLSMETLSPILSFYTDDGWEAGCARCEAVLAFGGIGHTLGLHATNERVIEQFALRKPAMRIVVNTVCALGSVGYTTDLFPALTLGPGTGGGSITSDNVSPLHLVHIKRVAFETRVFEDDGADGPGPSGTRERGTRTPDTTAARPVDGGSWMARVEANLLARAGNPPAPRPVRSSPATAVPAAVPAAAPVVPPPAPSTPPEPAVLALPDDAIERLIRQYRKG